ncbi:MAG: hypothetical protein JSS51_11645 [Planctomycetes bacterium]|nr:hypothetical protein [Planctomycetota bacterium]
MAIRRVRGVRKDLAVRIEQSAVDALLDATSFPVKVVEHREPFKPDRTESISASRAEEGTFDLSHTSAKQLFQRASKWASGQQSKWPTGSSSSAPADEETQLLAAIASSGGQVLESAKACLRAAEESADYSGPPKALLQRILNGGLEKLPETLAEVDRAASTRALGIKFKVHCSQADVWVEKRPSASVASPRFDLKDIRLKGGARGELWWYHPTFHCSWLCFKWSVTWGWDMILAVHPQGIRFEGEAHADLATDAATVKCYGRCDRLRLDYPILREIPLEGLANRFLDGKPVFVYDATKLLPSFPVIGTSLDIKAIEIPKTSGAIEVIAQVEKRISR